jgi:hypothetical protein
MQMFDYAVGMTNSPESTDLAMSKRLAVIRQEYPAAEIAWDDITGHWGAIERPPGGGEIFTHAPTLAELDIKLGAESSEAG